MDYPRMLYKAADEWLIVGSEKEQAQASGDGWLTYDELTSGPSAPAAEESPAGDVAELRARLDAMGIAYDGRWRAARLRQALGDE